MSTYKKNMNIVVMKVIALTTATAFELSKTALLITVYQYFTIQITTIIIFCTYRAGYNIRGATRFTTWCGLTILLILIHISGDDPRHTNGIH
jgi:hypothetical protein